MSSASDPMTFLQARSNPNKSYLRKSILVIAMSDLITKTPDHLRFPVRLNIVTVLKRQFQLSCRIDKSISLRRYMIDKYKRQNMIRNVANCPVLQWTTMGTSSVYEYVRVVDRRTEIQFWIWATAAPLKMMMDGRYL